MVVQHKYEERSYAFYNTEGLVSIAKRKAEVVNSIEEAEWMEEDVSSLYAELETIKRDIAGGATYYPMF